MTIKFIDIIETLNPLPTACIQREEASSLKEKNHEGRLYVKVGTTLTQHSLLSWWRVSHLVKSVAATAFALIGIPLIFSSYRHFLVHSWKQSVTGQELTKLYLLKTVYLNFLESSRPQNPVSVPLNPVLPHPTPSDPGPEQSSPSSSQPSENQGTPTFDLDLTDPTLTPDQIKAAFISFLQANPNNADVHAQYASFLHRSGDLNLADEEYRRATELNPDDHLIIENYLRFLVSQNKMEEIKQFLQERLSQQPNHLFCLSMYLSLLIHLEEWDVCDDLCQTIAALTPNEKDISDYVELVQMCAKHLIKRNKEEEAERIYQKLVASFPHNSHALAYYARFLEIEGKADSENLNLDQLNQALALYKRAIETEDASSTIKDNYFDLIKDLGKEKEIELSYLAQLEHNPNDVQVLANYAYFLEKQGEDRWEEAAQQYQKLLSITPQNFDASENYVAILEQLGHFSKIEQYFQEQLQRNPQDEELLYNFIHFLNRYAQVLEDRGHTEEAAQTYKRQLTLYPNRDNYDYDWTLNKYMNLLKQIGKENEIEQYFEELLRSNPSDEKTLNNFSHFLDYYAQSLKDQGHTEEAAQKSKRQLTLYPNRDSYDYKLTLDKYMDLLKQIGKENEIEQYFEELLQSNPSDEQILNNFRRFLDYYAQSLKDQGHLEEAAQKYRRQLTLYPNRNSYDYDWTLDKYMDLLKQIGKENEIEQYFEEQLRSHPEDKVLLNYLSNFLSNQAWCLEREGNAEEAVQQYKKLLALNVDYDEWPYIQLLKNLNKLDEINLYYQEKLKKDAKNERILFRYADFLEDIGQKEQAIDIYKKLLEIAPTYERAIRSYMTLLKELGKEKEAEAFCLSGLQKNPSSEELLYNYANLLEEQKRPEEAIQHYKKLLELVPDHHSVNTYIRLLGQLKRWDEVERYYQDKLSQDADNENILSGYANFLEESDQTDRAIDIYKKLLELKPDDEWTMHSYINLLGKLNKEGEIERLCQARLQTNPNNTWFLHAYAKVLEKQNRFVEAAKHYKDLLTIDPLHGYGWTLQSYIDVLDKSNQFDEIERVYEERLQSDSRNEHFLGNYARWLEKQKKWEKALEYYKKLLIVNPSLSHIQNRCNNLIKRLSSKQ
ncbi:tetratricopeptide repeat protein [Candidatus Protochlamydia phocaeensis]|uniref:tetratricopeptide repeat protein n=1 Tax=Candidatus Protochlamydia phocaeensis TaxID=1414722 RepID=UPI0008383460|nr:tetratricopeptide repeat protein [Candidatus Protochlamydia phocaeensis]